MKIDKKELLRSLKFLIISASAGLVEVISFTLLNEVWHLNYWVSYTIALVLSVIWNFTINRRYTFKSASNIPKAMLLVFLYYCVFAPVSILIEYRLCDVNGWNEYLVLAINMLLNVLTEFPFQRFVVFGKTLDTNDIAKREAEKENMKEE